MILDAYDSCVVENITMESKINFQDSVMKRQKAINDSLKNRVYNLETESSDKSFALDEAATDRFVALKERKKKKLINTIVEVGEALLIIVTAILFIEK